MIIVSYNVNGIRASVKLGIIEWLKSFNADIYCLQEMRADSHICEELLCTMKNYTRYYNCGLKKGYAGTAILTRQAARKAENGFDGEDTEGRTISLFFNNFTLVNCYVPNGSNRLNYKIEYLEKLLDYAAMLQKQNGVIICTDMNIAHTEKDCSHSKLYRTKSGFLPIERAMLSELFEHGFIDAYRQFETETQAYSWLSYRSRRSEMRIGTQFRYDYIITSNGLANKLSKCRIVDMKYSDHLPVILEIDLPWIKIE